MDATQSNGWNDLKNSGILGSFTYTVADQAYITGKVFIFNYGDGICYLNGRSTTLNERTGAIAWTGASFIPLTKGGLAIKVLEESFAERGLTTASQNLLKAAPGKLTQSALEHILERHAFESEAKGAGKFLKSIIAVQLKKMIEEASVEGAFKANTNGRLGTIAEYDFGKTIGITSKGVLTTKMRVVIINGIIKTAFPF